MAVDSTKKSSRLLQSRRYTLDTFTDAQEAFTRVLDLNSSEIYSQQNLILTSSLPYSGSSQNGSIVGVTKFWHRQRMTPGGETNGRQVWFFLEPYQTSIDSQVLQATQVVNFVSPKYSIPSLATSNTELTTPGYLATVTTSSDGGSTFSQPLNPNNYAFDYKTGVLQFNTAETTPPNGTVYITAYQYIGRTLESDTTNGYSGSFSGSFEGNGAGLTDIPASGIVGLNLTQIATSDTTASVSSVGPAFNLDRSGGSIFRVDSDGGYTAVSDSAITGSLEISQNLTVQGTASFGRIESVTGSAKIIGDAFIILNSDLPASRYAGILVEDSGSAAGQTGSLLYDAEADHWFYDSTAEGYASGFIAGPRATRDNITWPSRYAVTRGDGGNHIVNSNIFSTASNVTINKGATGSLDGLEILGDLEVTGSLRVTAGATGSFSGSFEGDGAGLTNLPASSIVGLNLTQIADTVVSASVSSAGGDIFTITNGGSTRFTIGDAGEITAVSTASLKETNIEGSATISQNLVVTGSTILSGSTDIEGPLNVVGLTNISSSVTSSTPLPTATTVPTTTGNYVLLVSESAWFKNHNVGIPRSNAWKDANLAGSYFENFDHNTNVSEVLRFLAGLLKDDAPSPTPNTATYSNVDVTEVNQGSTETVYTGILSSQRLSLGYTSSAQISTEFKDAINYGIAKGWSAVGEDGNGEGTRPWELAASPYKTDYSSYILKFTSQASSGTLFGTGRIDPPADFKVRLIGSMSFSDNASEDEPDGTTGTYTLSNTVNLSRTVASNSTRDANGLVHQIIQTANPAVIPNTFQQSRFETKDVVGNAFLTRSYGGTVPATATISSSGYYRFYGFQAGYTTGSDTTYTFKTDSPITRLWMPVDLIQQSMSATPASITAAGTQVLSSSIAPSRSLSGAPYLTAGTSTWTYSTTASGIFDPAYRATTVFSQTVTDSIIGSVTISSGNLVLDANGIDTAGKVYDASGNVKNSGLPRIDDEVRSTATITHSISSTDKNIGQGSGLTVDFDLATDAKAFNNDNADLDNRTIPYHQPGTFGQPASSGSLGIYGRGQGYDESTLTGTTENFSGEDNRVQINDNILSGSYTTADKFTTGSYVTDNLGELDLQVKPGYLIRPGGSYKYWLPTPTYTGGRTGAGTYRYYARAFRVTETKKSLAISLTGGTLGSWYNSSTNYAALILFQSVWDITGTPNVFDPTINNTALIAGGVARDDQYNPFNTPINIYGVGQVPSTPASIVFNDTAKQFVNTTYPNFILLFRYNGDRSPLTEISITYTT